MTASLRNLEYLVSSLGLNSLVRAREACTDLFGRNGTRWRVIRTSNAYTFTDLAAPKSKSQAGTTTHIKNTDEQITSNLPPRTQPTMLNRPNRSVTTLCHNCTRRFDATLLRGYITQRYAACSATVMRMSEAALVGR